MCVQMLMHAIGECALRVDSGSCYYSNYYYYYYQYNNYHCCCCLLLLLLLNQDYCGALSLIHNIYVCSTKSPSSLQRTLSGWSSRASTLWRTRTRPWSPSLMWTSSTKMSSWAAQSVWSSHLSLTGEVRGRIKWQWMCLYHDRWGQGQN